MEKRVILIDLGDTIMMEATEDKDETGVTRSAELIPGMNEVLREWASDGTQIALVADTRTGTYRNVLAQHDLYDSFAHFSISEELGVEKPHPQMFTSALEALGVAPEQALMIGNNYDRDVVGALKVGAGAIWFRWNDRYPGPETPHAPVEVATDVTELRQLVQAWLTRPVQPTPLVAAHRGTTRHAPENTMAAFRHALAQGARAIELDVQLTADEQLVVIHDVKLERTTNGHGFVKDLTLAALQKLDAGAWFGPQWIGERIPTLQEVLALTKGTARLNVELKHGPFFDERLESHVATAVEEADMAAEVVFMSFDHTAVARIKKVAPHIPALAITGCRLYNPVSYLQQLGADGLNQSFAWWTPEDLRLFGERGLIRHASCLNDEQIWRRVRQEMPVDMVDTDNFAFLHG